MSVKKTIVQIGNSVVLLADLAKLTPKEKALIVQYLFPQGDVMADASALHEAIIYTHTPIEDFSPTSQPLAVEPDPFSTKEPSIILDIPVLDPFEEEEESEREELPPTLRNPPIRSGLQQ